MVNSRHRYTRNVEQLSGITVVPNELIIPRANSLKFEVINTSDRPKRLSVMSSLHINSPKPEYGIEGQPQIFKILMAGEKLPVELAHWDGGDGFDPDGGPAGVLQIWQRTLTDDYVKGCEEKRCENCRAATDPTIRKDSTDFVEINAIDKEHGETLTITVKLGPRVRNLAEEELKEWFEKVNKMTPEEQKVETDRFIKERVAKEKKLQELIIGDQLPATMTQKSSLQKSTATTTSVLKPPSQKLAVISDKVADKKKEKRKKNKGCCVIL